MNRSRPRSGCLDRAARPVVIAGGGARHAGAELQRLVEALDCPLVTTAAGKGLLAHDHPANSAPRFPTGKLKP